MRSDGQKEIPSSLAGQMGQKKSGRGPQGRNACRTSAARKEMGHGPKVTGHGPHRTVSVSGFYRSCFICFLSNFWTNFFQFFYSNISNEKFV